MENVAMEIDVLEIKERRHFRNYGGIDLCCVVPLEQGHDRDLLGCEVTGDLKQTLTWRNEAKNIIWNLFQEKMAKDELEREDKELFFHKSFI